VNFFLIQSRDPKYQNAEGLTTYTYTGLVNKGSAYELVSVLVDQNNCNYLTESGYSCQVTVSLCLYPVTCKSTGNGKSCSCQILSYANSFGLGVTKVEVRLQMSSSSSSQQAYWSSSSSSVTTNGYAAVVRFTSSSATVDGYYRVNVTANALADGIYDDNYAVIVDPQAYMKYTMSDGLEYRYPADGSNFTLASGYLGIASPSANQILYTVVDDGANLVYSLSRSSCTVKEGEYCLFNITTLGPYQSYKYQRLTVEVPSLISGSVIKAASQGVGYLSRRTDLEYPYSEGDAYVDIDTYYRVRANFTPGIGYMYFKVYAVADKIDGGNSAFNISLTGTITGYQPNCWFSNAKPVCGTGYKLVTYTQTGVFQVTVINNDIAALNLTQAKTTLLVTRNNATASSQLTYYNTSESGTTTSFFCRLNSKPRSTVVLTLTASQQNPTGGVSRFEGIPKGGTYELKSKKSPVSNSTSVFQQVSNPIFGALKVYFTVNTWNVSQKITIQGLDDNYADGDVYYYIYIKTLSADTQYTGNSFSLLFLNKDDDKSRAGVSLTRRGTTCSEPYYGLYAWIDMYLKTEPLYPVTVGLSSNFPTEAGPDTSVVVFDANNYYLTQKVRISSVDDMEQDGDQPFRVVVTVLACRDSTYLNLGQIGNYSYVSLDDPSLYGDITYKSQAKLQVAYSSLTSQTYTTEAGGIVWLSCSLPVKPQGMVEYVITVDDPTEGMVQYPNTLVYSTATWNNPQNVIIRGVSDDIADGDITYNVIFYIIASETKDPYYKRSSNSSFALVNRDRECRCLIHPP
jgi:hypothetical protein